MVRFSYRLPPPAGAVVDVNAPRDDGYGGLDHATAGWAAGAQDLLGEWQLQVKRVADAGWDTLPEDVVRRAWLLLRFSASDA